MTPRLEPNPMATKPSSRTGNETPDNHDAAPIAPEAVAGTPTTDATTDGLHIAETVVSPHTAETAASDSPTAIAPAEIAEERARHAATIIRNHVLLAAASGVIPVNYLDAVALAGVQIRMLNELAKLHHQEFRADIGKSLIGTLLATVTPTSLAGGLVGSYVLRNSLYALPVIGPLARIITEPSLNGAFTYALGATFDRHFASGGTLLTFDPETTKVYFRTKYDEARSYFKKNPTAETVPAVAAA